MATTSTSALFTRSRVLSNASGTPKRLLAASADSRRLVDSAVISKSSGSDFNAGMCACAAHPRSGLAPMMPIRIFFVLMVGLLRRPNGGGEAVAGDLPLPVGLAQQEQFLVAARDLGTIGEDLDDTGRRRSQQGPFRRKQLCLGNLELQLKRNRLEDAGVGLLQDFGADGRRVLRRHQHSIVGIELYGSLHVAGVQRLLILAQQLLDLCALRLLRVGGRDQEVGGEASGCGSQ